ncbi:MAG: hypothetical protein NVSMB64_30170 [Candidatus Velthaea sp.]
MYAIPDLGIPDVKPAIELYHGVQRRKVSPQFTHARLQMRCAAMLDRWARGRGRVGTEWRFYFIERAAAPSSLVPDVAYLSFERLPYHADAQAEKPQIAPDIAIEILSPDERADHVREKIALYLEFGTAHVLVVDASSTSIQLFRAGNAPRTFRLGDTVRTADGFALDVSALFAPAEPPNAK